MVGTTTLLVNAAGTPNYNAASSSVQIYVYDNIAPVISAQTNLTKEATSSNGASVTFSVISTDNVDGTLPAACSPISGSVFSIGSTTVNCLATDSSGNIATSTTFIVNVVDTTAPIVGAASDVSVDTASSSVTVTYTIPTASDLVDGASDVVSCIPESGSSFAVGSHSVTCSATDTHGNKGTSSFNVIVSDTGAPVLTIPGDISNVEAVGTTGAVVSFNASAVDSVDGATAVVCTPSSGSTFALGNTVVTCTSQDSVPNIATGTFTVNVVDTTAPVISINGNSVENVVSGHSYTDAGASSTDAVDGDISSKIVVGNNVNTSVVGAYLVTYNVSDSHGNAAVQVSRTVNVLAAPPTTGNIRVVKIVQNSNGSTTEDNTVFTVGITGGETTATSTLAEGEDANFIDLSSATYTVTEATSSDYDTLSIFPNNFNLTLGSTTVVTVINRQHVVATSTPTTTESVDTATSTDNIIIKNVSVTGGGRKAGGRVLGASTYVPSSDDACIAPLKAYMRIGKKNDSTEVTKLQNFLNDNLGLKVPVTGYFGTRTESAVKAFQLEYSSDILGPWVKAGLYPNMNIPTGYVYKTTLWKINQIACPTASSSAPEIK